MNFFYLLDNKDIRHVTIFQNPKRPILPINSYEISVKKIYNSKNMSSDNNIQDRKFIEIVIFKTFLDRFHNKTELNSGVAN